jgi:hypothetical protein
MGSCYRFAVVTMGLVAGWQSSVRAGESTASQPVAPIPSPAPTPTEMPEVVVHGRAEELLGTAPSASQGSVGEADLADLPVLRRGELLEEAVPGMVVTQHSGDGKANQYFLRGFNLDHGTDFAFSIDGIPVNLPSHAHGQGYSDLNFLIPELVDAIDFEKGPFYAEVGDFSGAGAANIRQVSTLPEGIANVQLGQFGYARVLLADSPNLGSGVGPGSLLYALEYNHYDGPWDLPEGSNRGNALLRYHWDHGRDTFNVTGSVYWAPEWHATDQVPARAVDDGLIGRFGAIDQTDGGNTGRAALSFDWTRRGDGATTTLLLYGFYYRLNLWSNFSYALDDPANGDQFEQIDRRFVQGGELKRTWQRLWWGKRVENSLGLQVRNDDIPDSGRNHTAARQILQVLLYDQIEEANAGLFGNSQIVWTPWFRSQLGLRGDLFAVDVESNTAANSGTSVAAIVNPKATLVFGPWKKTEIYADVGSGFHSNDARGVTITVDPLTGAAQEKVPLLVRTTGAELGARTSIVPGLVSTLALWYLQSNSELTFSGDSGDTAAKGPSRKYGLEWSNFYKPTGWLTLSADLAFSHARYTDPQQAIDGQSGIYIANSIPLVISAAAVVETPRGIFGGVRLRYFSSQPLIEDDSQREPGSTIVNALCGYRFGRYELSVGILNLFDAKADDIAYYYTSRLPTSLTGGLGATHYEPAGVNDLHIHPVEPFQVRGSMTVHF